MRKKNITLLGIAALALTAFVGGTWAVWTQELTAGNEFKTAYYSTKLEEKFQSPDDWQPGVETEKNVWLSNPGEVPVLTKAVVNQSWIRRENVLAVTEPGAAPTAVSPLKGEKYPLTLSGDNGYAAVINFNQGAVAVLRQGVASENGQSVLGLSVVDSFDQAAGRWLLLDETPDADGNWTFYYVGIVEAGHETPHLIESVTMNPHAQNSILGKKTSYVKNENGYEQVTIDLVNPEYGYDNATYTLTVSMTTVQATKAAVEEVFRSSSQYSAAEQVLVNYLASEVAASGIFQADEGADKRLYFNESDGVIQYGHKGAGSKTEDGNWFMSFTDMVPGGIYVDEMTIENHSRKNFDIFMQIVPRDQQSQIQDELLGMITMKIFYNDQRIYDGTAMGAIDPEGNLMQEVRPLGYYGAGSSGKIRVELQLSPNLKLEGEDVYYSDGSGTAMKLTGTYNDYMNVLTKIDWKFMVQEREDPYRPSGGRDDSGSSDREIISNRPVPTGSAPVVTTIEGEEVPLAFIPDEEVPLIGAIPQTGDEQPIFLLIALMALSGGMILFLFMRKMRRRRTNEA